ncbi:Oxoglutarate/iron-dependent oxygenase [Niveomyces insectorum RCEF 264]|uniref:Oxoglutarate/iron-dependent oxygenase n=1 Tax=Niveomyces insectorum RCEF 264 TaxID=1081102 RepID=A0A167RXM6_9HYPO|nr:Oxoglutarate/iron-dependent oxygenase [Niveomyces insectorum RCEF 264]
MAVRDTAAPEVPLISLVRSTPKEVLQALSTIGFIHLDLDGTGITQADVDRAFALSSLIHAVPADERTTCLKDAAGNGYFGMTGSLDERARSQTDRKESFVWGRGNSSGAAESETTTTQPLPDSVQNCRQELAEFDNKCFEASLRVLDVLSLAFDLPEHFFRATHRDAGSNALSLLNYPALDKPPESDDIRAGSHKVFTYFVAASDSNQWGDITLLFQETNGQPGLQIYLPPETVKKKTGVQLLQGDVDLDSGTWISAPIVPNTVLVNVGLTLEAMTDGLCKANIHRVVFPKGAAADLPRNRKTIAYFSTPSHDITMNPVKPGGVVTEKSGMSVFFTPPPFSPG